MRSPLERAVLLSWRVRFCCRCSARLQYFQTKRASRRPQEIAFTLTPSAFAIKSCMSLQRVVICYVNYPALKDGASAFVGPCDV